MVVEGRHGLGSACAGGAQTLAPTAANASTAAAGRRHWAAARRRTGASAVARASDGRRGATRGGRRRIVPFCAKEAKSSAKSKLANYARKRVMVWGEGRPCPRQHGLSGRVVRETILTSYLAAMVCPGGHASSQRLKGWPRACNPFCSCPLANGSRRGLAAHEPPVLVSEVGARTARNSLPLGSALASSRQFL
jgi:hypothetical protein